MVTMTELPSTSLGKVSPSSPSVDSSSKVRASKIVTGAELMKISTSVFVWVGESACLSRPIVSKSVSAKICTCVASTVAASVILELNSPPAAVAWSSF